PSAPGAVHARIARSPARGGAMSARVQMTRYGTQFRLARALLDYLTGVDPSAIGLVGTLLALIPRRPGQRDNDDRAQS
ncbi:MAG TPA: hypothetical protein VHO95_13060, partial [Candidatus Dormibacteraeota bacterium]|nr:hypothetical protein [Candidatus Dormibacteraeota bacterium]